MDFEFDSKFIATSDMLTTSNYKVSAVSLDRKTRVTSMLTNSISAICLKIGFTGIESLDNRENFKHEGCKCSWQNQYYLVEHVINKMRN